MLTQNTFLIRDEILKRATPDRRIIVAIDGRCASGKSTLAAMLAEQFSCSLIHMDDFFLRPEQRTPERLAIPGENVDHERLLKEVLAPLAQGKCTAYRPWDCHRQALGEPVAVKPTPITIIEGSYVCHPALFDFYDLRIFLTVSEDTQLSRIAKRGGEEALAAFRERWIPLEERYFSHYDVAARCDLVIVNE